MKKYLAVFLLSILVSCQKIEPNLIAVENSNIRVQESTSDIVSPEEAKKAALSLLMELSTMVAHDADGTKWNYKYSQDNMYFTIR
jgi:hypothetical protein